MADVVLLRWPADRAQRDRLALEGRARILLLGAGAEPPDAWDELEDWVREPVDAEELEARCATVRHRARILARRPRFDEEGLLWSADRWVDVAGAQGAVARLLVEHFDRVVPTADLQAAYEAAGGRRTGTAWKSVMVRLRRRFEELDLELRPVRGRGVVLTLGEDRAAPPGASFAQGWAIDPAIGSSAGRAPRETEP